MSLTQCESFDGMTNARCCFHAGHSGDHFHSREDESDRIRWKIAADERDQLRAAVQMLAADNARLCDRLITAEAVVAEPRKHLHLLPRVYARDITKLLDAHDAGRPS